MIIALFTSLLFFILHVPTVSAQEVKDSSLLSKYIKPDNIKLQFAGNIGMFSTGIGYESDNNHWKGDVLYGFVPKKYAADKALHLLTLKGKYGAIERYYAKDLDVQWLNIGLWVNYAFGKQYFSKLPKYYPPDYYVIKPGVNLGAFVGSEVRQRRFGAYYEIGTTEKHVIHFIKNIKAIPVTYIFNTAIGIIYHFD